MSLPSSPNGIRFVPENTSKGIHSFEFRISYDYLQSRMGIFTSIQMLTNLITFAVSASLRTHNYEVTDLVVYMAPKATILFVMMHSFCFFYTDLLIMMAATVSDFDALSLQESSFYMFATLSAAIFNLSTSVAIFLLYARTVLNLVVASAALIAGLTFAFRGAMISVKLIRLHRGA